MRGEIDREQILKGLRDLAFGRCNDAVKLSFLDPNDPKRIEKVARLDLRCLESVKTGDKGVEIKLVDRAKLIELLLEATEERQQSGAAAAELIGAINGAADRLGMAGAEPEPETETGMKAGGDSDLP